MTDIDNKAKAIYDMTLAFIVGNRQLNSSLYNCRTGKIGCSAMVRLALSDDKQALEAKAVNGEHNHEISKVISIPFDCIHVCELLFHFLATAEQSTAL